MSASECALLIGILNSKRGTSFFAILPIQAKYIASFCDTVALNDKSSVGVTISFTAHFPLQLPHIHVSNNQRIFLHADSGGKLCLFDDSALLINRQLPAQILIESFDKALQILNTDKNSSEYCHELQKEFGDYWSMYSKIHVHSCLDLRNVTYGVYPILVMQNEHVLAENQEYAKNMAHNRLQLKYNEKEYYAQAPVIRLRTNSPLPEIKTAYKWSEVRQYILENTSSSIKHQFTKYIQKTVMQQKSVVVLIMNCEFGDIVFGFSVTFIMLVAYPWQIHILLMRIQ